MKFKTAYSKRTPSETNIDYSDIPSMAVQEQKESTDINNILRRFQETGLIEHVNEHQDYGDFTNVDFQTQQNTVAKIQSTFNELPGNVRQQFNHNPQKWIDHISNPDNVLDMKDGVIDNQIVDAEDGVTGSPVTPAEVSTAGAESPTPE